MSPRYSSAAQSEALHDAHSNQLPGWSRREVYWGLSVLAPARAEERGGSTSRAPLLSREACPIPITWALLPVSSQFGHYLPISSQLLVHYLPCHHCHPGHGGQRSLRTCFLMNRSAKQRTLLKNDLKAHVGAIYTYILTIFIPLAAYGAMHTHL